MAVSKAGRKDEMTADRWAALSVDVTVVVKAVRMGSGLVDWTVVEMDLMRADLMVAEKVAGKVVKMAEMSVER